MPQDWTLYGRRFATTPQMACFYDCHCDSMELLCLTPVQLLADFRRIILFQLGFLLDSVGFGVRLAFVVDGLLAVMKWKP